MFVSEIRLADFRSYEHAELTLTPGVTTFVGANGQGKTNLVEAIGYASTLSSHRVATDAPLVRFGAERAVIGIEITSSERSTLIELELNPGRANRARLNKSPVARPRELIGLLQTVMFAPEDLALVKGDPSDRRRFVDDLLVQRSPRMTGVKADYERILKQRNALLKSAAGGGREAVSTIEVWDEQFADAGADLVTARLVLVERLRPYLESAYALISGGAAAVSSSRAGISYASSLGPHADLAADRDGWRKQLLAAVEDRRREELARGITVVGPHRDDLVLMLGEHVAKGYASHGESWSMALALRFAALDLMQADGEDPVLILDDVFAELDAARRSQLVGRAARSGQVLITAAVGADVPVELSGRRMLVTSGQVLDA